MIESLTVVGNGTIYYYGTPPIFGSEEVIGKAVQVDVSMFKAAQILVEVWRRDPGNCKTALRMLFTEAGGTLEEANAAVEMVLALLHNRGAIWQSPNDKPTVVK